jgi:NAD(P)-dependent dehydrogenase (short-subunit alcohol dehydrogenase family)
MTPLCAGRVVVVTNAGRGLGRAHALAFAQHGACVVVNDPEPFAIVDEIRALGGEAVPARADPTDWVGAAELVDGTITRFGRLDVLVNTTLARRPGRVALVRHAAAHWRGRAKHGEQVQGRLVNTSAEPAARVGIVGLTLVEAGELARYGVTVNAIVPATRGHSPRPYASPVVVWLGSVASGHITGRVFAVAGD